MQILCDNMGGPRGHAKSITERQIPCDLTDMWNPEQSNTQKQRVKQQFQGLLRDGTNSAILVK